MTKYLCIGIDPDVDKSGFAIWNKQERKFESIEALALPDMMTRLQELKGQIKIVVLEAGFLDAGNRHVEYIPKGAKIRNPLRYAAQSGERTGANHQRGKDIAEILEWMGIPYRLQKPMSPNLWKEDAEYFKMVTGWPKVTNREKRDAGMLVFNL